ncbi:Ankyrin repeat and LEM domain-containing protein 2 [Mactra antiquata]
MDEILKEVKTYDCDTLRQKLIQHGVKVGPIAGTTISFYQKRLAKVIFLLQGGVLDENVESENTASNRATVSNKPEITNVNKPVDGPTQLPDVFYAVCLPENGESANDSCANELVFSDKGLALKTAKQYKGSRFKVFKSEDDAKRYVKLGSESSLQSPCRPMKEESQVKETVQVVAESSPFKAPKPQELSTLKRVIEQGDVTGFTKQVWENPRYLVSGGDTPSIYQEGSRYTAMHVAAIKNKPEICQAILDILEDPQFVSTLYSQSKMDDETQNSRINFLVDLYLNMPDKGCCESPLHMACKYGHDKVVEILAAHPSIDKGMKNKWGCTPKDLICTRCQTPSPELKNKIEELLKGQCYVPLIRSEDNIVPPVIGQPWSPDVNKSIIDVPHVLHSPIESALSVKACAGPMSPSEAGIFHRRWTTPPTNSPDQKKVYFNTKRSDSEKGMERIGRQLAHEMQIPWSEYWEFLDQFVDLSSSAGLELLENYLKKRSWLKFVIDFKDRFDIEDDDAEEFQGAMTPVATRSGFVALSETSEGGLDDSINDNKLDTNTGVKQDGDISKVTKDNVQSSDDLNTSTSDIVSPMTNLSMKFSKMKLNDSLSEKAALNLQNSDVNDTDTPSKTETLEQDKNVEEEDTNEDTSSDGKLKDVTKDAECDNIVDENDKVAGVQILYQRSKSIGSDSTASYQTAPDEDSYFSLPLDSLNSEPDSTTVTIILKDKVTFEKLSSHYSTKTVPNPRTKWIVQLKDSHDGDNFMITVVSIPELENVQQIVLFEDMLVDSMNGSISSVMEGEMVDISVINDSNENVPVVSAYLTRAVTLPKCGFLHGPQPTREDLNVSRAIGDTSISPDYHPNIFNWKLTLSKFVRDTNYRWQSPAKLPYRSTKLQSSPLASPYGQKSPVIPYRSLTNLSVKTSDIRTKLFPSISE